uniref:CCHC-type domain-containing protein n=1 Tax=Tanacetum cinerariifolium TaxID=118510 RepID=A0A6L2J411_TANCI|nr:hypothetical protein [Tanacetum cinerariifolium]
MQNPEDISNPTTALDMALEHLAMAFHLNNTTPTNNKKEVRQTLATVRFHNQNVRNQNRLSVVAGIANQHGNGNVVAARAEGNSNEINKNLIRCYSCQKKGHYVSNCTVKPRKIDVAYHQTQLQIAQKEKAGIQLNYEEFDFMTTAGAYDEIEEVNANCTLKDNLQKASTSGSQTDKALVYDSDGLAEVQHYDNCYNNDIFNMFTQEEQYTKLLEPIPEPHQVQQNDGNVISAVSSVEQSGGTVEQHSATVEETRTCHESLFHNLAAEVEKVNSVNRKMKETNANLTTELVRYKNQEKCFEISQENMTNLKDIDSTTRTGRPQSRNNPKNERVPYKSKSSCISNKLEKIEENHRSLQPSNYPGHTSSKCNNIKLAIRNEKPEVICVTCKQCQIIANHDECVLQYMNVMKSKKKNQSANVLRSANQNKHKADVKKSKKSGSKESLASPSKPRSFLKWLPTGRIFDLYGKITSSINTKSESDTSMYDNASASNPQEPTNKGFPSFTFFLDRFTILSRQNTCIHPLVVL